MNVINVMLLFVLSYFAGVLLHHMYTEISNEHKARKNDLSLRYNATVDEKLTLLMERFNLGELDVYVTLNNLSFMEDGIIVAKICTDLLSDSPYGSFRDSTYYGKQIKGAPNWRKQLELMKFRQMIVSRAGTENAKIISNKKEN